MNKKLNRKGFTLVELLAVLVLLTVIMRIAIPSLTSTLERTAKSQNEARYKMIEANAEQYIVDHKNAVYDTMNNNMSCYIKVSDITTLSSSEMEDADGNDLSNYYVVFTKPNNYKFISDGSMGDAVISCIK